MSIDVIRLRTIWLHRLRSVALLLMSCVPFGGCGLISGSDEYIALVDSVAVPRPMRPGGAVTTTFYGYVGNNACAELVRV